MNNRNFSSQAWLLRGLIGSTEGVLALQNERLSFTNEQGQLVFDVPFGEVRDIQFPWHLFSGGLTFMIGADKYRVTFVRPGNTAGAEGNFGDVADGRAECKKWKAALT